MRFNLKTIAVLLVFLALLLSAISSRLRTSNLEGRLLSLRDSHGFVTQETYGKTGDRWETVPLGALHSPSDTFLLRVRNFSKYRLRVHFFDGITKQYKTDTHDFVANETVIRYLPDANSIYVHDTTWPIDNQTFFKITGTSRYYNIHNGEASDVINENPIRGFGMLTTDPGPVGVQRNRYKNRDNIEEICVKHKMKIAWFTIEKMP